MGVTDRHTYAAPIETVKAMFADEAFIRAKYEGMGHREVDIAECTRTDDGLTVRSTRVVEVDLPGFAKKVMTPVNTMTQVDTWTDDGAGGWSGTFDVEVKGAPVHVSGTMSLRAADDSSCVHEVTTDTDVKVRIIGGKIREWAEKNDVPKTMAAEFAAADAWIADHP